MEDEDEDLPNISLNSPFKTKVNKVLDYKMPKATDLAAQRKVEEAQEEIVSKIINKNLSTVSSESFDMPDAEELAAKRRDSDNQKVIIESLLTNLNQYMSDLDKELPNDILQMEQNVQHINIFVDCPGIDIKEIKFNNMPNVLTPLHTMFIEGVITEIGNCADDKLENIITSLFIEIRENVLNQTVSLKFEDILCYVLLLCGILLDKRCRNTYTLVDLCEILQGVLKNIPAPLQSTNFLDIVSDKILLKFSHFHDRLYIAECLEGIKCDPIDLDTNPLYFSTRMAKYVLQKTICELVGYGVEKKAKISPINFKSLKNIIMTGKNTQLLEPYQQYVLVKILNMLNSMITVDNNAEEVSAKKWFLGFFNSMKCNQPQGKSINADFCKVKVLCACTKLLWRDQCEEMDNASGSQEK